MKGVEGDAYNLREATIPFHILLPFPIERGGGGGGGGGQAGGMGLTLQEKNLLLKMQKPPTLRSYCNNPMFRTVTKISVFGCKVTSKQAR